MHLPSIHHLLPVSIFNIALDQWAVGKESTTKATISIQCICLFISFGLFFIRLYQIISYKPASNIPSLKLRSLQFTHLAGMFFNATYILTHFWNYIHLYAETNDVSCSTWFYLVVFTYYSGKTFTYTFLMIRSALAFDNSLFSFQVPLYVSLTVICITTIALWVPQIIVLSNFTPISPIPGKGFCFRIPGPGFDEATVASGFIDVAAAIIAVAIFWRKAAQINTLFKQLNANASMSSDPQRVDAMRVNAVFKKHIYLGSLIFILTFIVWFVVQLFTVLLGIFVAMQNVIINLSIFLLFKENDRIYDFICCKAFQSNNNVSDVTNLSQTIEANLTLSKMSVHKSDSAPDVSSVSGTMALSNSNGSQVVIIHA